MDKAGQRGFRDTPLHALCSETAQYAREVPSEALHNLQTLQDRQHSLHISGHCT